jgi:acetyltransferase-like isoleucine patch superfamily enzyme
MRRFIAVFITLLPFNFLRILFYRYLLGYKISFGSSIKPFNVILCKNFTMASGAKMGFGNFLMNIDSVELSSYSVVGRLNKFRDFHSLVLGEYSVIRNKNLIFGTSFNFSPFKSNEKLIIGHHSNITSRHSFDLSDEIRIGNNVTLGGSETQLWTHGFDLERTKIQAPIFIGDNCYFGSRCLIMLGCTICDQVSIGAGTTVSKSIENPGFYTSSSLVFKAKNTYYKHLSIESNGYYFYRKK